MNPLTSILLAIEGLRLRSDSENSIARETHTNTSTLEILILVRAINSRET
jgi:hypothetical protein